MIVPCWTCDGNGCDEGCGLCLQANAGPWSHKICRDCMGRGEIESPDNMEDDSE